MKPLTQYVDDQGITVTVFPEKKVRRKAWMRGEAWSGAKMRIGEDEDRCFVRFKRKNGKY